MDDPSGMGLAALVLAKKGFHVFPIRSGTKDGHRGGWKELATNDPDLIMAHWKRWPNDNIGVATEPSGYLVLDVDVKKGHDGLGSMAMLELEYGDLPETLVAETPSGGLHFYFRISEPVANTAGLLGDGLDTRSQGGYVLGPASELPEGLYKWKHMRKPAKAPQWLVEAIGEARKRDPNREEAATELDLEHNIKRAVSFLVDDADPAIEGEGGNGLTYVVACHARDCGITKETCLELMLEHYNPRCEPPWEDEEVENLVANAYQYAAEKAGVGSPEADFADEEGLPARKEQTYSKGLMNEWLWVGQPKIFLRREDRFQVDRMGFDSLFNHLVEGKGKLSDEIFDSKTKMRKLMRLQYRPGAAEFLGEEYNLWRDSGCGSKAGGTPWLEEHMRFVCGDNEVADYALDYLAYIVQNRGAKMSYSLLIQGGQGIGKSMIGELMECILGEENVSSPSNEELHGNFTSWAAGKELIIVEELMATGKQQMANKLKPLITESSIRVDEKYKTPYNIENHMNFLIFTNHEDPIPLENDDRRFLVIMSDVKPKSRAYYDNCWKFKEPGHLQARQTAHWLMKRDLSKFNPKGRAPATEAKEQMRRLGLHEVETWALERFDNLEVPFDKDLVAVVDVIDAMPQRLQRAPRLANLVGRALRQEIKAVNLGQHRVYSGSSRRVLWSVRRHEMYDGISLTKRGKMYDEQNLDAFEETPKQTHLKVVPDDEFDDIEED